jgi:hypothetical protein
MLPNELILYILDILGENGFTRTCINLTRIFQWNENICNKYLLHELQKSRNIMYINYDDSMIDLWERTGIDDGVPFEYLLKNLNKKNRMYRTIWSHDVLTINNKNVVLTKCLYDCNMITHDQKMMFTSTMIKDKRKNPNHISVKCNINTFKNYINDKTLIRINYNV